MKNLKQKALAVMALGMLTTSAFAEKVIIGHFGNPTPMQVAVQDGRFNKATGWEIEWRKFGSGTDVIAAMASGDINISELGSSPLAIAATQGLDIKMFMLAQVIGEAESLIVSAKSGIKTIADLKGKRIAVPVGSTAHISLMGVLDHAKLKESDVTILNMPPDQIAAAWQQDALDGAFIWHPVQSKLISAGGTLLVSGAKVAEWGWPTFDGWVVSNEFAKKNAKQMIAFAKTMDAANKDYLNNVAAWDVKSDKVKILAKQVGAEVDQVPEILKGFTFLPLSEQVKPAWLGKTIPTSLKNTAVILKGAGRIDKALNDYSKFVDVSIANSAK